MSFIRYLISVRIRWCYRCILSGLFIETSKILLITDQLSPTTRPWEQDMMTSSNGNIFPVTGHLCGEFTGHRWIPLTKASDAELWCFFDLWLEYKRFSKQWWCWWFETPSHSLWRHCNVLDVFVSSKSGPRGLVSILSFSLPCHNQYRVILDSNMSRVDCIRLQTVWNDNLNKFLATQCGWRSVVPTLVVEAHRPDWTTWHGTVSFINDNSVDYR